MAGTNEIPVVAKVTAPTYDADAEDVDAIAEVVQEVTSATAEKATELAQVIQQDMEDSVRGDSSNWLIWIGKAVGTAFIISGVRDLLTDDEDDDRGRSR